MSAFGLLDYNQVHGLVLLILFALVDPDLGKIAVFLFESETYQHTHVTLFLFIFLLLHCKRPTINIMYSFWPWKILLVIYHVLIR